MKRKTIRIETQFHLFLPTIVLVLRNTPNGHKKSGSTFLYFRYAKLIHKIGFSKSCFLFLDKVAEIAMGYVYDAINILILFTN